MAINKSNAESLAEIPAETANPLIQTLGLDCPGQVHLKTRLESGRGVLDDARGQSQGWPHSKDGPAQECILIYTHL